MEKRLLLISAVFLLAFMLTCSLVIAESGSDSGSSGSSDSDNSGSGSSTSSGSSGALISKTKIETDYDEDGTKVVTKKITEIRDGVEVTRDVVTKIKNGIVVREKIKEKRKFVDSDGEEREVELEIEERNVDGKSMKLFRADDNGIEARSELEIRKNESADGRIVVKVKTKDGKEKEIKVLPDRASEIAKARLKAKFGNNSLEIREIVHNNLPRVVYHLEGNSSGKFLGIFKTNMNVNTEVDAETGEVVVVNRPWWSFMVKQDAETETETETETGMPVPGDNVNESIVSA